MAKEGEEGVDERKPVTKNSRRAPLVVKGSKPLFCIIYHVLPCRRSEEVCGSVSDAKSKHNVPRTVLSFPTARGEGGRAGTTSGGGLSDREVPSWGK